MFSVDIYKVGVLDTNCYLLRDLATGKSAIIDPGGISRALDQRLEEIGGENVEYILLTHGHFDHIRKILYYKKRTQARVVIFHSEADFLKDTNLNMSSKFTKASMEPMVADIFLDNMGNDTLQLGETLIKTMHTPGHTGGGVCYLADGCIFTGDTLMDGSIGRTDLVTGSMDDMQVSLGKLARLSPELKVYPGHGSVSTLAYEMANNPYLQAAGK